MEIIFGISGIIAGWLVINAINPIHSVLALVLTFINLSILLLLLGLEFLPLLFIIVYVGAIAILFLFVIMMLDIKLVETSSKIGQMIPIILIISSIFIWEIYISLNKEILPIENIINITDYTIINKIKDIELIGQLLYETYFIHLILGGIILLIAMIGAIVLTITHEEIIKRQDLFAQISTKHINTIRYVK
jgi:NADH-quinone oxidoreductase subunit J